MEDSVRRRPVFPESSILESEVRAELERILSSPAFAKQERLQRFLSFIVERALEGCAEELKERTIGVEALGRRIDYDPKIDPIVRVQARRLRDKLAEFYDAQVGPTGVQIVIPKGSYVPEFVRAAGPIALEMPPAEPAPGVSERAAEQPKRSRTSDPGHVYFLLGCLATLVVAALFAFHRHPGPAPQPPEIRLFAGGGGTYNHPVFSPDGHSIAFDWGGPNDDNVDIYVQRIDSDVPMRLTSSAAVEKAPAWSPDGKRIVFLRRLTDQRAAVVTISAQGGAERTIGFINTAGTLPRVNWSPDRKTLVTSDCVSPESTKRRLVLMSADTGSERALTEPPLEAIEDGEAVFSPDGSMIAFVRLKAAAVQDIFVLPARGGEPRRLTWDNTSIAGLAWAPHEQSVVFLSRRDGGAFALWKVPASGGTPLRLTATPANSEFPSISPDGKRAVFAVRIQDENIWRMDLRGNEPATRVIESPQTDSTPAVSPDGTLLAFRSSRTGHSEIWLTRCDGGSPWLLTHSGGAEAGSPDWSPDGRLLAYTANLNTVPHIWLIPRSGGTAKRLSSDMASETTPYWSRDGASIYYASNASGAFEIWRKPVDGGPAVQMTHTGAISGQESFDRQWLYFTKGERTPGVWRQPLAGGPEEEVAPQLPGSLWGNWRTGRGGVYFLSFAWVRPYSERLYFFEQATGLSRVVASTPGIPAPFGAGLGLSPDERWAYFVQVDHLGVSLYFAEDLTL